jgi:N-acetylglucosamine-6-phosphate deacetylase
VTAVVAGGTLGTDGLLVVPGLVDLQVNGAAGVDLSSEPERLWDVAAHLPRHGVTRFLPTIVTTDGGIRERAIRALAAGAPADGVARATPIGLHFEGPMLSPERCGAHPPEGLRPPSPGLVEGWTPERGIVMTTIAPELPGALEVIRLLSERGVVVSIGHTAATLEQVDAAVAAGARAVTHLYNAMPGLGHYEPGPVGAALSGGDLVCGVIVDGRHVHPRTVAATWRALGPDRFLAVSDTTAALDLPPGPARLGRHDVVVGDGDVRLASDSATLAGSAVGVDACIRNLVAFTGCTPEQAVGAATTVPARLFPGLADRSADVTLLDADLRVAATVVGGRVAYDRDGRAGGLTAAPGEEAAAWRS